MSETTELEAVDAALEAGAVSATDPAERELQELALALRADAPEPGASFEAELGRRVQAGFPRRRRLPRLPAVVRRRPMVAMGAAASTIAALAVAGVLLTQPKDEPRNLALDGGGSATEQQRAPSAAAPRIGEDVPPGSGDVAPGEPRRVQRTAQLTLAATERRMDSVAAGIQDVTGRYHGFVQRSSLTTGRDTTTGGSFDLRIPVARLDDALRDIAALGTVRSRTQSGDDVTGSYVSARDRLSSLRAERRSLLRRLAAADDDSSAETLRQRLDANATQIGGARSELRRVRSSTDYASVSISLVRKRGDGAATGGGGSHGSTGAALDDAADTLVGAVNLLVRGLGYGIPVGLVAALLWLGGRTTRRRRREAVLS